MKRSSIYQARWIAKNRDKYNAYHNEWCKKNRKKCNEYRKRYLKKKKNPPKPEKTIEILLEDIEIRDRLLYEEEG